MNKYIFSMVIYAVIVMTITLPAQQPFWSRAYRFSNGHGEGDLAWQAISDNELAAGPSSFHAAADGSVVIADSVNYRLVCRKNSETRSTVISLDDIASRAGIPERIAAGDLTRTPEGIIYVADYSNNTIHIVNADGEFQRSITNAYGFGKAFNQINRMQIDGKGRCFIEDLSGMKTIVTDSSGKVTAVLPRFTSITVDEEGNIYRPLFEGNPRARKIDIHDARGGFVRTLGTLFCKEPISHIFPIGVDNSGRLYLYLMAGEKSIITGLDKTGRTFMYHTEDAVYCPPGSVIPYRVDRGGNLYLMKIEGSECYILRSCRN